MLDTGGQVLLSSHDDVGGRPLYEDDTIATNHLYWVSGVTDSVPFTKGPAKATVMPPDAPSFTAMSVVLE